MYELFIQFPDLWDKYTNNFEALWVASAYKGATGPCMNVTDIDYHVGNHISWLKEIQNKQLNQKGLQGVCMTGWQR